MVITDVKLVMFLFLHYMYKESLEFMRMIRYSRMKLYNRLFGMLSNKQPYYLAMCLHSTGVEGVCKKKRAVRRMWMKQRSSHWWNVIAQTVFIDSEWKECFRMRKSTFQRLCEIVIPRMKRIGCGPAVREEIPDEKKLQ